jgi:hypothetical protein
MFYCSFPAFEKNVKNNEEGCSEEAPSAPSVKHTEDVDSVRNGCSPDQVSSNN